MKYGYYDNPDDIKNVVHPLIDMLDGRTDVPYASECMHVVMTYDSLLWWVRVGCGVLTM